MSGCAGILYNGLVLLRRALTRAGSTATIAGAALLAGAAVALAGTPAASAAAAGASKGTLAGNAQARSALLTRQEIGSSWSQSPPPKTVPPLTCPAFSPSLRGDHQIGAAISPRFQGSSSGPFVSQTAYVYATAAQGTAVARALMRAALGRCIASGLLAGSGDGVTFAVSRRQSIVLPELGVAAVGFRVLGTASQAYQLTDVDLDAIVLAHGQTVTEVSFATFYAPAPRSLELRLARRIAKQIAAP